MRDHLAVGDDREEVSGRDGGDGFRDELDGEVRPSDHGRIEAEAEHVTLANPVPGKDQPRLAERLGRPTPRSRMVEWSESLWEHDLRNSAPMPRPADQRFPPRKFGCELICVVEARSVDDALDLAVGDEAIVPSERGRQRIA